MTHETLGVVIVNYNCANFVKECIDSVLSQSIPFDEIIFVDDCSTDNSNQIMENYSSRDDIQFIKNSTNIGLVSTLNNSIKLLRTDLVLILNSDDYLHIDCVNEIKRISSTASLNKKVIFFDMIIFGPKGQELAKKTSSAPIGRAGIEKDLLYYWCFENQLNSSPPNLRISGSSVYSRILFQEVGGYKNPSHDPEDAIFFNECISKSDTDLLYVPKALLYYRQHGSDQTNSKHNLLSRLLTLNDYTVELERIHRELERDYFNLIHSKKWRLLNLFIPRISVIYRFFKSKY
jgi:glycosyltransferase involved in cell wall biosynthesis